MAWILVAGTLIGAGVCHLIAKRKRLNVQLWIILGALFGPFAIPFVLLAKPNEDPQ